jgi:hypothetical protein
MVSSFSVLMTALFQVSGHRAAGVAGAASARNDGQAQIDAALDQPGHFGLGIRRQHDKRVFHAPVGGVGHMGHTAEPIELDVVARSQPAQGSLGAARRRAAVSPRKAASSKACDGSRPAAAATRPPWRRASAVNAACGAFQPRPGGAVSASTSRRRRLGLSSRSSCRYGLRCTTQMSPSTSYNMRAERPVRARRAATQGVPGREPQQPDHDLPVRKRGVVVRDFPQARRVVNRSHQMVGAWWGHSSGSKGAQPEHQPG